MSIKTIKLTFPHLGRDGDDTYRVDTLTQSTEYAPGQFLAKAEVDDFCKRPAWKVTIARNTEKR